MAAMRSGARGPRPVRPLGSVRCFFAEGLRIGVIVGMESKLFFRPLRSILRLTISLFHISPIPDASATA